MKPKLFVVAAAVTALNKSLCCSFRSTTMGWSKVETFQSGKRKKADRESLPPPPPPTGSGTGGVSWSSALHRALLSSDSCIQEASGCKHSSPEWRN